MYVRFGATDASFNQKAADKSASAAHIPSANISPASQATRSHAMRMIVYGFNCLF
jgi:hypothetical protein